MDKMRMGNVFRIKPIELQINESTPFAPDILDREKFSQSLTNLIMNTQEGFVLALDAAWGEGKTTFCKQWMYDIKHKKEVESIYIDAFNTDHLQDPFTTLSGEIYKHLPESFELKGKFKEKANNIGKMVFKNIGPILLKVLATRYGLDVLNITDGDNDNFDKELIKSVGQAAEAITKDSIGEYLKQEKVADDFKSTLKAIVKKKPDQKLIIIIDELDRCRPSYAVEVLERIKHFFEVKGVIFVLVINKVQLMASIRHIYGDIDSNEYLQKFINIECPLPKRGGVESKVANHYESYCDYLFRMRGFNIEGDESLKQSLLALSACLNLGLRAIEKVVGLLAVVYSTVGDKINNQPMLVFLAVTKVHDRCLYDKLKNNTAIPDDVIKFLAGRLNATVITQRRWIDTLEKIEGHIKYCVMSDLEFAKEGEFVAKYQDYYNSYNMCDRKGFIPLHCRYLEFGILNE